MLPAKCCSLPYYLVQLEHMCDGLPTEIMWYPLCWTNKMASFCEDCLNRLAGHILLLQPYARTVIDWKLPWHSRTRRYWKTEMYFFAKKKKVTHDWETLFALIDLIGFVEIWFGRWLKMVGTCHEIWITDKWKKKLKGFSFKRNKLRIASVVRQHIIRITLQQNAAIYVKEENERQRQSNRETWWNLDYICLWSSAHASK